MADRADGLRKSGLRTPLACWAAALLALAVAAGPARAAGPRVRLLNGKETDGVWGTDAFRVSVNSLGLIRDVRVGGKQLVARSMLYAYPLRPGTGKLVRSIQGARLGPQALTVLKPKAVSRDEGGRRVLEYTHLVANRDLLGGRPVCKVVQRVAITPAGEIHVSYDCEWLVSLRWEGFFTLTFFAQKEFRGREYTAFAAERVLKGRMDPTAKGARRTPYLTLEQLTLQTEAGPLHVTFEGKYRCAADWTRDVYLYVTPRMTRGKNVTIYKGQKTRMAYRFLLPVTRSRTRGTE